MRRYFSIWRAAFIQSLKSMLAFRADFFFSLINLPFVLAAGYVTIFIVASETLIAGWDTPALIILGGLHLTIGGLEGALIEPNLEFFSDRIIAGELDELLLKPVRALFAVSLIKQNPGDLLLAAAGLAALCYGMITAGAGLIGWLLLLPGIVLSLFLLWGLRMLLAEAAFYLKGLDLTVVYSSVWQFQKYPAAIYPSLLRTAMLAVPFTLVCLPVAEAARGGGFGLLAWELAAAAAAFGLVVVLWRFGIRRYTSAP